MSRLLREFIGGHANLGDVGIEVEVEWDGNLLPRGIQGSYSINDKSPVLWIGHGDNSLRNGYEFVLSAPIKNETTREALTSLYNKLPGDRRWSQRTSIHCHFNMLDTPVIKVYNNILGFWVFEDLIIELCAPHRKGNLFALPWSLADYQVTTLVEDYNRRRLFGSFSQDRYKYACLNLCNLTRLGTLELRILEGTEDIDKICMLFGGVFDLFKSLSKFEHPAELFDWFYKTKNAEEAIDKLLPNDLGKALKKVKNYQEIMQNAIAQLSYAAYLDWDRELKNKKSKSTNGFMEEEFGAQIRWRNGAGGLNAAPQPNR